MSKTKGKNKKPRGGLMKAFHGDKAVKEKYLNRVLAHQAADEIIKGKYWQGGKGCAVGCTIHSDDHYGYEHEIGVPAWLAFLQDKIFEGLPNAESKKFPADFSNSEVTCGKYLFFFSLMKNFFFVKSKQTPSTCVNTHGISKL